MNDILLRVFAKDAGLRGLICTTGELSREAARRHNASPIAAAALSQGLTAATLLGALLKVQQRVALKLEGDGALRKLVAESDAYGRVRGYVAEPGLDWPAPYDAPATTQALGRRCLLTVVRDLGLRDLHQGAVALEGDTLDTSLAAYFTKSEQTATVLRTVLATDSAGTVTVAGGVLFQPLPGASLLGLQQVAATLNQTDDLAALFLTLTPEQLAAHLLGDLPYTVLEQRLLAFSCTCSRARSRQALKVLSADDLLGLIVEGEAVVDCHFCHERYVFSREELGEILDEIESEALDALLDDTEVP